MTASGAKEVAELAVLAAEAVGSIVALEAAHAPDPALVTPMILLEPVVQQARQLFFALTGALQLFDLHEPHPGYQPPVLIEKLGRLHKDQVFARDDRHPGDVADRPVAVASGTAGTIAPATAADTAAPMSTSTLKWFFLLVTLVLALMTRFGLWLGLRHDSRKRLGWFLFASGLLLPAIVVML